MFLEYYGLREQPFGVTPNPRFMYASPSHREVLASLLYAVQSDLGFSALIADPGMGKTTLLFDLLERYRNSANTAFLFNTQCNSRDLLRHLLSELGVESDGRDQFSMHERFKEVLLQSARDGKKVLIILDEAHNFDVSVLETVRLLSNFETSDAKLMHIILAGQTQLANKLMSPGMTQLYQRISIVNRLKPFTPEETIAYINHRLDVAGYKGMPLFSSEAIDKIASLSQGVPRTINRLCLASLSIGCALNQRQIQASVVDEVSADLNLSTLLPPQVEPQKKPARIRANSRSYSATAAPPQESPAPAFPKQDSVSQAALSLPQSPPIAAHPPDPAMEKIRNAIAPQQRVVGKAALRAAREPTFKFPSRQFVTTTLMVIVGILVIAWLVLYGIPGGNKIFANSSKAQPTETPAATATQENPNADVPKDELASPPASISSSPKKTANKPILDLLGTSAANAPAKSRTSTGPNVTLPSFGAPANSMPAIRIQSLSKPTAPGPEPAPPRVAIASATTPQPLANAMGSVITDNPTLKVETPPPEPAPSAIVPGHVIQNPKPTYPDEAKRLGIEGSVVLTAVITKDGKVKQVRRVSGDARLANAAEEAVRHWKYDPYTLNGEPIEANTSITIKFTLAQK
ncbi:MAG: peptidoglycan-binding protein [Acidobacteriales bacterium]|nr:peptidoglycan-binding protein [Terriglobales bacterium]